MCSCSVLKRGIWLHCSHTVRACGGGGDGFLSTGEPTALLNIVTGTEGMLRTERQVRHRRLLRYIINKEDKLVGSFHTQLLTHWLHMITAERFSQSPTGGREEQCKSCLKQLNTRTRTVLRCTNRYVDGIVGLLQRIANVQTSALTHACTHE